MNAEGCKGSTNAQDKDKTRDTTLEPALSRLLTAKVSNVKFGLL